MTRPLRIAHIDTERTWRGGEQQVLSLIKGLSARGHSNLSVVRKGGALSHRLENVAEPVFRLSPLSEWDVLSGLLLRIKIQQENIDVVHAHTGHAVALAALATLGLNIPFVLTRRVDFHLAKNFFSHWKYGRAAKIVAISDGVRRVLLSDGVPPSSIALIPSGVDFERFKDVRPADRSALGVPANAQLVGQVAALAPHKDQRTFLHALALLQKKKSALFAVIVGSGDLLLDLQSLARSLAIEDRVKFLGYRDDALSIIAACDVFCLSSKEEGLGTSILDAMALRVPVVATRAGGIPELVENGRTGYLAAPQNPEELATALSSALNDPYRQRICDAAYQKAKIFDIDHTILHMESLYKEISNSPKVTD